MMKTPPGVSQQDFAEALRQFETAVGKDGIFTSEEDVALYRDAYSPLWNEPEERIASAAVAPDGVEQVQEVVRIANRFRIPLYPISTGRNLGYGGSAPVLSGRVVLDLKRMDRILEVNERGAYALVEPGVSYFDLYRYIQDNGLKLWIDCPDPGWGSLIGNALDHGAGATVGRYRDHFDAHCGMEVVLANGEILRTGMGAMPGAWTWQQHRYGYGPWIDGMFSQSNFGVVTKMGFWLLPEPEAYLSGMVTVPEQEGIIPLVDALNYLENTDVFNGMPQLVCPVMGAPGQPPDPELAPLLAKPGAPVREDIRQYARSRGKPWWRCQLRFYGSAEVITVQWKVAKQRFSAIPGVTFEEGAFYRLPLTAEQRETEAMKSMNELTSFGIPTLAVFAIGARSRMNPVPTDGHVWFSPIIPKTGEAVLECLQVLYKACQEIGIPESSVLTFPLMNWLRNFVLLVGFPITRDIETNRKNRDAFRYLVRVAAEHGWGEYRTAPAFMDAVMDTYRFNDHALRRFHETLKDAVDPNGILSAGRYGIWPKHLRGKKGTE